jgi:hypothetical protein
LPGRGHCGLKIEPDKKMSSSLNKILGTDPFTDFSPDEPATFYQPDQMNHSGIILPKNG